MNGRGINCIFPIPIPLPNIPLPFRLPALDALLRLNFTCGSSPPFPLFAPVKCFRVGFSSRQTFNRSKQRKRRGDRKVRQGNERQGNKLHFSESHSPAEHSSAFPASCFLFSI